MKIDSAVSAVLNAHKINLDTDNDYTETELIDIQSKVIVFLNKKINTLKSDFFEKETDVNLDTLNSRVLEDYTLLGYDGFFEKYSIKNCIGQNSDESHTIALAVKQVCESNNIPLNTFWSDLIANYGIVPVRYIQHLGD